MVLAARLGFATYTGITDKIGYSGISPLVSRGTYSKYSGVRLCNPHGHGGFHHEDGLRQLGPHGGGSRGCHLRRWPHGNDVVHQDEWPPELLQGWAKHTHTPFSSGLWGFPVWGLGSSVEGWGAGCSGLVFTAVMYMRVQPCQIWRPKPYKPYTAIQHPCDSPIEWLLLAKPKHFRQPRSGARPVKLAVDSTGFPGVGCSP